MRARGRRRVEQTRCIGAHAPLGRRGRRSPPASSLGRPAGDPAPPRPAEQPFPRFVLPAALVIFIFLLWAQRGVCFSFILTFSTCVCFVGLRVPVIDTWFFSGVRMGRGRVFPESEPTISEGAWSARLAACEGAPSRLEGGADASPCPLRQCRCWF